MGETKRTVLERRRGRRGHLPLEFFLVALVFAGMGMAVVDVGRFARIMRRLDEAVRDGARHAAMLRGKAGGWTVDESRQVALHVRNHHPDFRDEEKSFIVVGPRRACSSNAPRKAPVAEAGRTELFVTIIHSHRFITPFHVFGEGEVNVTRSRPVLSPLGSAR